MAEENDNQAYYDHIRHLAETIVENIPAVPASEKPKFVVIMGAVTLEDVQDIKEKFSADALFLHVLDAFTILTEKTLDKFTQEDISNSMFLASSLAIEAFHERRSIVLDIGLLEAEKVEKLLLIMKALGYETVMNVIADDEIQQTITAMSEEEQWLSCAKDELNSDLILYLFEDVTGSPFTDETQQMLSMGR